MNYMKEVAQMLGVELGEEFKIEGYADNLKFQFRENRFLQSYGDAYGWVDSISIINVLEGRAKIIKLSKPILDDTEKKDISGIIEPFRRYFKYIKKCELYGKERIVINIKKECDYDWLIELPPFKKGTMYKGMKAGKDYTLDELGL